MFSITRDFFSSSSEKYIALNIRFIICAFIEKYNQSGTIGNQGQC